MNPSAITTMRRENEAGAIVALAVMAALLTVLLAIIFPSCSHAAVSGRGVWQDEVYTVIRYL
mgnify:CR=1 FL=1